MSQLWRSLGSLLVLIHDDPVMHGLLPSRWLVAGLAILLLGVGCASPTAPVAGDAQLVEVGRDGFPLVRSIVADRPQRPAQADVGDVPIVLLEEADGQPSLAFHRMLSDGRVLDFFRRGADIVDAQTGSRWGPSDLQPPDRSPEFSSRSSPPS